MTEGSKEDNYKVLLVEDESNIAMLFGFNLQKAGYTCEIAENGKKALEVMKSYVPDLIISDIMMPEMDGFNFRKALLADPLVKSIPFVFLTAKGAEDDILQGYDLEIEDYILKTSSPKIVMAKVSAILKSQKKERAKAVEEVQQAADKMGAKVVPDEAPVFEGFDIKHWHVPYQNVPGGDFIDYFKIDNDHLAIVLGDVMGKKWGAWYFAVAYAGYVRSAIRFALQSKEIITPSSILHKVNESVFKDERISDVFVTLSVIILNKIDKSAKYAGAGDLPLIIKQNEVKSIQSGGLLLGFSEDGNYDDFETKLNKGDELILITDGIIESRNHEGHQYGTSRLLDVIKNNTTEDPLSYIRKEFSGFTGSKYEDDVSAITVKAL